MDISRRHFNQLALSASAGGFLPSTGPLLWASLPVPFQPFASQIERLLAALASIGQPLEPASSARIQAALRSASSDSQQIIEAELSSQVLLNVTINPETRVSVSPGSASPELLQGGWRPFLIRVRNEAGVTALLRITSPEAGPMGRRSSLAITGVHDVTNGAVDAVESQRRWLSITNFDAPPLTPTLSGLPLEYRIVQLYSRDSGMREAKLEADAGFGEQDLGFRSTLPILFRCVPAFRHGLRILDEHGKPTTASLLIQDTLGRIYPPQTKRESPDLNFEPQVYRRNGERLDLPAGTYVITAGRGPEYLRQRQTIVIGAQPANLAFQLERWVTPSAFHVFSGDTHIHAAGCSHYESPTEGVTPEVMVRQVEGEALDLGSVLNWGPGFEYQKQFFTGHVEDSPHHDEGELSTPEPHVLTGVHASIDAHDHKSPEATLAIAGTGTPIVRYDIEVSGFPSSHCGHLVLLRLKEQHFPGAPTIDDWPSWNIPILRWAKAQGAVTGYAHSAHGLVVDSTALPNFLIPPFNSMGANEFIVDVTHAGVIDFISGCDLWPFAELNIWYHTLNCGFRTAFAGETDFPCITDECVGGGRSYVSLPATPEGDRGYSDWLEGLLSNHSYFGDGRSHIFNVTIGEEGLQRTEVAVQAAGSITVSADVCALLESSPTAASRAIQKASPYSKPYWHLERARIASTRNVPVDLLLNGYVVDSAEIDADGRLHHVHFNIVIHASSWIALRIYPSAHTNPIFITIAGTPFRAFRKSVAWCRQCVDVCWEQKWPRIRPTELTAAVEAFDHARRTYDRILRETPDVAM